MKNVMLPILLTLATLYAAAQQASVSWLPTEQVINNVASKYIVYGYDVIYRIASPDKGMDLQRLDRDFKVQASQHVPDPVFDKKLSMKPTYKSMVNMGERYYLLYYAYNKVTWQHEIWAYEIKKDCSLAEHKVVFSHIGPKYSMNMYEPDQFIHSDNKAGNAYFYCQNFFGVTKETVDFVVYNDDMSEKWKKTFELDSFYDDMTTFYKLQVSNDAGTIAGAAEIKNAGDKCFVFNSRGYKEVPLPNQPNFQWYDIDFKFLNDSKTLVVAASYYDRGNSTKSNFAATGVFVGYYNIAEGKFAQTKYIEYGSNVLGKLDSEGDFVSKYNKVLYHFAGLEITQAGTINMVINRIAIRTKTVANSNMPASYYEQRLPKEKIFISVDKQLSKTKMLVIPRQAVDVVPTTTVDDLYIVGENAVVLYYEDNNDDHKLLAAVINEAGAMTITKLELDQALGQAWQFRSPGQIGDNKIVLEGQFGGQRKYGVVRIQN